MTQSPIPKILSTFLKYDVKALLMSQKRPLLSAAIETKPEEARIHLREEEDREREADRRYWAPLRKQLEEWRTQRAP